MGKAFSIIKRIAWLLLEIVLYIVMRIARTVYVTWYVFLAGCVLVAPDEEPTNESEDQGIQ